MAPRRVHKPITLNEALNTAIKSIGSGIRIEIKNEFYSLRAGLGAHLGSDDSLVDPDGYLNQVEERINTIINKYFRSESKQQ